MIVLFFAIAITVLAATNVTEFVWTSTCHVAATLVLWYPKFALWALLILCALHVVQKLSVLLGHVHHFPVLFARSAWMGVSLALQTITFGTFGAIQFIYSFVELKSVRAAGCGAPSHVLWVFVNKIVQSELIIFFDQIFIEILLNIVGLDVFGALFDWTFEGESLIENRLFHTFLETLLVVNVAASQNADVFVVDFDHAHWAFG
jgi:hypothetical protein